jgi:hypothetical protein
MYGSNEIEQTWSNCGQLLQAVWSLDKKERRKEKKG